MTGDANLGPEEVVAFWREAGSEKWFKKDAEFDRAIVERFQGLHAEVASGRKQEWAKTPLGALALILVLDQFSRNMFRDTPKAFAQDDMACGVAHASIAAGFDKAVPPDLAFFLHMPFMHAERIGEQENTALFFHALGQPQGLDAALAHRDIIRRFGRFPHRNRVLGRHTTPAEQAFLEGGGFAG